MKARIPLAEAEALARELVEAQQALGLGEE